MNLNPHHVQIKELTALGLHGGSGSGDDEDSNPRKPKKKSRSPREKTFSSSEERLIKSSDEEKSENYGTFDPESKSTPKKKKPAAKPTRSQKPVPPTKQPTEMEGSAVHGLDVFSHEEKASQLRKLNPPGIIRTRKFPPESPASSSTLKSPPETSIDYPSTGAISKKKVEKLDSVKSTSKHEHKHKSSRSASLPKTIDSPAQESDVKQTIAQKPKEKSKDSKLKSACRSPRKAIRKCFSLLTSPQEKDLKEQKQRPRTRSQSIKEKEEKRGRAEQVLKPKTQTEQKSTKKVRARSTSSSARPVDEMSLIRSMDKSSESDTSPQFSPRKVRRKLDPLHEGSHNKPNEREGYVASQSDSYSSRIQTMELDPSIDMDNSSTGDNLLTPLAKLSTDTDKEENSKVNFEEQSKKFSSERLI